MPKIVSASRLYRMGEEFIDALPEEKREGYRLYLKSVKERLTHEKNLKAQFRAIARIDPLTRIPNRRGLTEAFRKIKKFMDRHSHGIPQSHQGGMAVLDICDFGEVNRKYGHDAGDGVLQVVAKGLSDQTRLRPLDTVGRFGGDEFIILLEPGDRQEDNQDRMRQVIAKKLIEILPHLTYTHQGQQISIGLKFGFTYISPSDTFSSALKRADPKGQDAHERGVLIIANTPAL